jgi:hypothetical protein
VAVHDRLNGERLDDEERLANEDHLSEEERLRAEERLANEAGPEDEQRDETGSADDAPDDRIDDEAGDEDRADAAFDGERLDGQPVQEPAPQPTAFGAATVGGAVAASALAGQWRGDRSGGDPVTDDRPELDDGPDVVDADRPDAVDADRRDAVDADRADAIRADADRADADADADADRPGTVYADPAAGPMPDPVLTAGPLVADRDATDRDATDRDATDRDATGPAVAGPVAAVPVAAAPVVGARSVDLEPDAPSTRIQAGDRDGDGTPDTAEPDRDGDGMPDAEGTPWTGAPGAAPDATPDADRPDATPGPDAESEPAELLPGAVPVAPVTGLWDDDTTQSLRERWRDVQLRFVDDPEGATGEAQALVAEAVDALTANLAELRADLDGWRSADNGDTEQLRVVVRRYRDFLDRLLDI